MQFSRARAQSLTSKLRCSELDLQIQNVIPAHPCAGRRLAALTTHVAAPAVFVAHRPRSRDAVQQTSRQLSVRMHATPEGSEGGATVRPVGERERSQLVNEEVVYFIFQLDLDTQLQRCLNYEAYEAAQEVRKKRQRVDEAVQSMKERKAKNTGAPAAVQRLAGADYAAELLRLRTEMQRAVEAEDYASAAKFRDLLKELETEAKKAAALAAEWDTTSPSGPVLRLGQRVLHKQLGYRGVVVGWDMRCCESEDWIAAARVGETGRGISQPFYHLLVDARDWEYDPHLPPVAYVPEELLTSPELEPAADGAKPKSWAEVYGTDPLQHPYLYILFLGMDGRGDYVPCRQLRDRYNVQRRDVYKPGQEGGEDDSDDDK